MRLRTCQPNPACLALAAPSAAIRRWTLWFKERVISGNGGHFKKSTIVALARKLLVALWKYVNTAGVVIDGAVMKDA